ncbi:MAG: metallophosphoesterase, partial [Victivallaceae bacterium]|nr:metallophosphoesterase [Victivallaceae bacterium]
VKQVLAPLRDSSIPVIYLPGNHDCYVKRPKCVTAMREMVEWLTRGAYQFDGLPIKLEYAGVEFILLNCSRPSNLLCSWGFVTRKDADHVAELVSTPRKGPRVLVSHYPMFEAHPWLRMRHRLFGQEKILELLRSGLIDLSLCGHVHRPSLKTDELGHGECCAGSVTMNGSFKEIDCDTSNSRFTFRTVNI